jgi:hypothetical protein
VSALGSGKAGDPPPAPNYLGTGGTPGLAEQQQRSQMSSQYTPYGSQVYSPDGSSPSGYRSDITLNPQAQQTLDQQLGLSNQFGNLAQGQLGNVSQTYSHPMDLSSVQ